MARLQMNTFTEGIERLYQNEDNREVFFENREDKEKFALDYYRVSRDKGEKAEARVIYFLDSVAFYPTMRGTDRPDVTALDVNGNPIHIQVKAHDAQIATFNDSSLKTNFLTWLETQAANALGLVTPNGDELYLIPFDDLIPYVEQLQESEMSFLRFTTQSGGKTTIKVVTSKCVMRRHFHEYQYQMYNR